MENRLGSPVILTGSDHRRYTWGLHTGASPSPWESGSGMLGTFQTSVEHSFQTGVVFRLGSMPYQVKTTRLPPRW